MVNDGKQNGKGKGGGNPNGGSANIGSVTSDRRTFLKAAGVGGVVASLAGCANLPAGGGGGGDGLGDTVTVGAMGPADSPFGASILNTAELAAEQFNEKGGIGGAAVEVVTKDTKDDPGTARSVYQELIEGANADLTVGIFGSEQLLAILPNIAQNDVLHLSTGAATPEATRKVSDNYEKFKTYFRVGPLNSVFLAKSDVAFAKDMFDEMGWERVAYLAEDFKWTQPKSDIVPDGFRNEVGVEVPVNKRVAEGTEDFTPIYDELESANVDGCYTALAHIGTKSLVQWAKGQRPFGYGGIHVPAQLPAYYGLVEGAAESVFTQTSATPRTALTDKTVPYADAYNAKFDGYPVYDGYTTQDAMNLFKIAAEEEQSTSGEDLVPVLEEVSYTGTAGTIEFYGRDHEFTHDVKYGEEFVLPVYFQWQDGEQQPLWPPAKLDNTVEYQQPVWMG